MINSNLYKAFALIVFLAPQVSYGKPATIRLDAFIKSYINQAAPQSTLTIEAKQNNQIIKTWDLSIPITYDPKRAKRKCKRFKLKVDDESPLELIYSGNLTSLKIAPTPYKDTPLQNLKDVKNIQLTIFIPKPSLDSIVTETYVEK